MRGEFASDSTDLTCANNGEDIEVHIPFTLEPATLSNIEMHSLDIVVEIKADRAV